MENVHRFVVWFIILISKLLEEASATSNYPDGSRTEDKSYMLPQTVFPEAYRVDIITNLADYNQNFTFEGKVWIVVKVVEPTNKIVLHSKNLEIFESEVTVLRNPTGNEKEKSMGNKICENGCKDWMPVYILSHNYNEEYELYEITLNEQMNPQSKYLIFIPYQGELTQSLAGYYRSSYKELETGETRWIAVTQFESTDARRALPCFDEPAFKAVFQVNLGHVAHRTSISNMELEYTEPIKGVTNWVWDHYATSVRMSTYLLAFVVCDFSHKVAPSQGNNVLFRAWARKDAIDQVDYAIEVGPKVLLYFEKYFDVKYPLSKLDMIAVPDFSSAAMENWGLITYREVALLYDAKISTASSLPYVASVVAHEIAHQWFGNLVTMKWWTDLWLNEGFATYVAALGVQYLHPEWNYYEEEVVDNLISVLSLDSLKSSHPISVPIGHPREIAQIFDTISYKKGSYVLRMMNLFLGEETFTKGITRYLQKHAYCNAEQDDLWRSLTEEAHANKVLPETMTVKEIMDSWTLQTGYPVLSVNRNDKGCTVTISQERFLSDRNSEDSTEEEKKSETLWWVPVRYTWESENNFNETKPQLWLSPKDSSVAITGFPCDDWILLNIQVGGLYRVKYDDQNWKKLTLALNEEPSNIDLLNRVQLIDDSLELAKTGDLSYETAIGLMRYLVNEVEYLPWKTALRNLGFLDRMMRFTTGYGYFRNFMSSLLYEIYYELCSQKQVNASRDLTKIKFQSLISAWACKYEIGDCRENAVDSFNQWMQKPYPDVDNPIPKDHRSHVYCTAIKFGGEKEWSFLWQRYMHSNVGNEKSLILSSLTCTREVWLLNRYLDWSLNEKSGIRKQDSVSVFAGVARGNVGFYLAMNFLKNRIHDIYTYFGPKTTKLGNYFSVVANQVTTDLEREELIRLVNTHEKILRPSMQAIKQGLENAKINVEWQKKFYNTITQLFLNEAINKIKVKGNN